MSRIHGRRLAGAACGVLVACGAACSGGDLTISGGEPNATAVLACGMSGPGVHADFGSDGASIRTLYAGSLQKIGAGAGQELISVMSTSAVQRKFIFILPSLAPGDYPVQGASVTYVSYAELVQPPSSSSPPKVWQAVDGAVHIGTCGDGGSWFDLLTVRGWPPALGSGSTNNAASGVAYPGRIYGRLP